MNRMLLSFSSAALLCLASGVCAQTVDSVRTGQQYTDQVFYSLRSGTQITASNADWDIAFQISGYSSAILINDGMGAMLYSVPNSTAESWSDPIDTTGMAATWPVWYNSPATWDVGAFTMDRDYNTGDFGWGQYSMITHTVSGTTVYVIRLLNGEFKKIFIDGLAHGRYSFRYADLDGSNEVAAVLDKKDFQGKNFGYYSLADGQVVDREPLASSWDLTFGKYIDMAGANNDTPYPVTGVRANAGVLTAEVHGSNAQTADAPSEEQFTSVISTIGYDWKSYDFGSNSWIVSDTTAYFVRTPDNEFYRLVFTDFSGSGTGTFYFETMALQSTDIRENDAVTGTFALYPNTIESGGTATAVVAGDNPAAQGWISIYDMAGRELARRQIASAGIQSVVLGTSALPRGMYHVVLYLNGGSAHQRLIVH